jgi:hypothetical protein
MRVDESLDLLLWRWRDGSLCFALPEMPGELAVPFPVMVLTRMLFKAKIYGGSSDVVPLPLTRWSKKGFVMPMTKL